MMISRMLCLKPLQFRRVAGSVQDGKGLCAHGGAEAPGEQRKERHARGEPARVDLRLQSHLKFQLEREMLRRVSEEEDSWSPQRELKLLERERRMEDHRREGDLLSIRE